MKLQRQFSQRAEAQIEKKERIRKKTLSSLEAAVVVSVAGH